jgi:hypothetical protein
MGFALNLTQALPYGLRSGLVRAIKMDTILADLDEDERAEYEARIGRDVAADRQPGRES